VGLDTSNWLSVRPIILLFILGFRYFSIVLCIRLCLFYLLVLGASHYICSQPLDLMGIHLLHHTHGEEKMTLHDVV